MDFPADLIDAASFKPRKGAVFGYIDLKGDALKYSLDQGNGG